MAAIAKPYKILAISGSLRKASCNHGKLLSLTVSLPSHVTLITSYHHCFSSLLPLLFSNTHLSLSGILRAVQQFIPEGCSYEIFVPSELPLFNSDLSSSPPEVVVAWREKVKAADVFVIATPEYNFSVTAPLKNCLDWASQGPLGNCFADKPAMIVSAGGGVGGLRSQIHLRDIALFLNLHIMNTNGINLAIYNDPKPFDLATGDLTNPDQIKKVEDAVKALIVWADRLGPK